MPTHAHPCPPMPCAGSQGPTGLRVVPLQLTGLRVGCCRCRAPHHTPRGWEHPLYLLVARKLGAPTHPRPTRVALLLTDCACAQRGADSGARIILPAGLFLAVRHLVRNSPSSPRHRCAIRPRASVRAHPRQPKPTQAHPRQPKPIQAHPWPPKATQAHPMATRYRRDGLNGK